MTIARTGNKILDAQARQGALQARREVARQKAVAKKSGKKSSSVKPKPRGGKFKGAGNAGRAACKRGGKGMSAKFISKGSNAAGAVSYGMKDGGRLINSNCGFDIPSMSFGLSQKLRPEIMKQIVHLSFSTPPVAGRASERDWGARLEFIRQRIGLNDSFSYAAFQHEDAAHDHLHLFFNRVSDEGTLWKDNQIGLRLASLEQHMEQKFSLRLVDRADFQTTGHIAKDAILMAVRQQVQPETFFICEAIKQASRDKPDVLTFISRLADQSIAVRPNLKNEELNGFSYSHGGVSVTGKQAGANWSQLKETVHYVIEEHFKTLADLKRLVDAGKTRPAITDGPAEPTPAQTSGCERQVENTQQQARASLEKSSKNPAAASNQDRRPQALHIRRSPFEYLAELRARLDDRRIKFAAIRAKLEATPCELSDAFVASLAPSLTEFEFATEFLRQHGASKSVCALLANLDLTIEQMTELLMPYQNQIKNEAAYEKRMNAAGRNSQDTEPLENNNVIEFDTPSMM